MFRLQIPELEERSQSSRRGARARRSAQIGWELEGLEQRELLTAVSPVTAAHVLIQNAPAMQLIPVSNLRFSQPTVAHPQDAGTKPHPLGPCPCTLRRAQMGRRSTSITWRIQSS